MSSQTTKILFTVLLLAALGGGCSQQEAEQRAREAAERIRAQVEDPQGRALTQDAPPALVKEAQGHLRTLGEYLGEVDGKLDSVTVNAIEAFQMSAGLEPDGMLQDETVERLRAAAEKAAKL